MAKKAKTKEAAPAEEAVAVHEPVEEKAPELISYKLSPAEALSRLRDMDFAVLTDDDRRSVILEIKGLLSELMAAQESLRHLLEERLWLLQTWDNVVQLRVASVKQELPIPPLSMNVSRYFDEKKLEEAALAEQARIDAELAAEKAEQEAAAKKAEEEAKAKAAEEAAAHADDPEAKENQEHTEHAPPHDEVHEEPHEEHHDEPEAAADEPEAHDDDQEMLVSDVEADSIEPVLALDPNEEGYVKLRLIEATEFDNIRLPPHINIEIKQEHAEELVSNKSARPLPADTPLDREPGKS
jgi:flagellar biosynthesis GTPase FlhF